MKGFYKRQIEIKDAEIERLKQGSYASRSPNVITVNLDYHNNLLKEIERLKEQVGAAEKVIDSLAYWNENPDSGYMGTNYEYMLEQLRKYRASKDNKKGE